MNKKLIPRRRFLNDLAIALSLPHITNSAFGKTIQKLSVPNNNSKFFLEINLRDQWDFAGCFLAPSLAINAPSLPRDKPTSLALFTDVIEHEVLGKKMYLTKDSTQELGPHLENIAILEVGETPIGSIHGHEASNAMRSPGRSYKESSGTDMGGTDKRPGGNIPGNEIHYSSIPTPGIYHNFNSRDINGTSNGVLIRSMIRQNSHTVYHHDANLTNAQVDRFFTRHDLLNAFSLSRENINITQGEIDLIKSTLSKYSRQFLKEALLEEGAILNHTTHLDKLNPLGRPKIELRMSEEEIHFWAKDVPPQQDCPLSEVSKCREVQGPMNLGEIFGYVYKMFRSNTVKTACIDFDFYDVHTTRDEYVLRTQAKQLSLPLSRLIGMLKETPYGKESLFEHTIISIYTTDGSRGPQRLSVGDGTKNSIILCGGGIKGGYYGDVSLDKEGKAAYYPPGNDGITSYERVNQRVLGKDIYKTLMKALNMPGGGKYGYNSYPEIRSGKYLPYFLRG